MAAGYDSLRQTMVYQAFSAYQDSKRQPEMVISMESWRRWKEEGERLIDEGILEPAEYVSRLYGLDAFEQFCAAVLTEMEIDREAMENRLKEIGFRNLSPVALISLYYGQRCFERELFASFLKGGRLAGWLIEVPDADGPSPSDTIRLDGRIRNLLLGEQWDDEELLEYGFWMYPDMEDKKDGEERNRETGTASGMKGSFGEKEYCQWSRLFRTGGMGCVLKGPEGIGKKTQVRRYVQEYGCPVFCADRAAFYEMDPEKCRRLVWRIVRECRIQQAVFCVDAGKPQNMDARSFLNQAFSLARQHLSGFLLLQSQEEELMEQEGEMLRVRIPMPTLRESAELWQEIKKGFPCSEGISVEEFAGTMVMTPGQIRRTFLCAMSFMKRDGLARIEERHLKESCGRREGRLCGKAVRVEARYHFQDLILPAAQKKQLREICGQVKNRYHIYEKWGFSTKNAYGTGISVVFSGPPGTGKTMAAQVMAKELGLELYKVDLSAVVSKYIGETEKNLNLIFDEGRQNQAILFFDEADVLFSKRTEVRDSHDKYSNMEAAFLLQKMEEYTGVAILATNYIQNMDEAFKRRLTFMIDFPFPDRESRRQLWESMVPEKLPLGDTVDFEFLSQCFEMSGSQIKNSLVHGAFLAADSGKEKVEMADILKAVRKELLKSGKKLTEKEMGEYSCLLEEEAEVQDV